MHICEEEDGFWLEEGFRLDFSGFWQTVWDDGEFSFSPFRKKVYMCVSKLKRAILLVRAELDFSYQMISKASLYLFFCRAIKVSPYGRLNGLWIK